MLRVLSMSKVSRTAAAIAASIALAVMTTVPAAALPVWKGGSGGSVPGQRVGAAPAIPRGAQILGPVPAFAPVTFDIVLQPRDPAGLGRFATLVSTPGSASYRHFLTTARFAARFGQPGSVISRVAAALRGLGLPPGRVTANHLVVPVATTVGRASAGLHTQFARYRLASGRVGYANTAPPLLPAAVAQVTQSVVGLSNLVTVTPTPPAPSASPAPTKLPARRARAARTGSGPQPCQAAVTVSSQYGARTYDQLANAYSVSGLYGEGINGNGATIALFELEPWSATDVSALPWASPTTAREIISGCYLQGHRRRGLLESFRCPPTQHRRHLMTPLCTGWPAPPPPRASLPEGITPPRTPAGTVCC
jgi:Pro-kumamolisin, activation domain